MELKQNIFKIPTFRPTYSNTTERHNPKTSTSIFTAVLTQHLQIETGQNIFEIETLHKNVHNIKYRSHYNL
jgi:hypothetical protein